MHKIQNQLVVTPTDKVNGNVALPMILCTCSHNRTGLDHNNQVNSSYTSFLRNEFNLVFDEENINLSNIYWTPKLHKHPLKARFIVPAPQCSVKPFSKAVTSVLKLVYKQVET